MTDKDDAALIVVEVERAASQAAARQARVRDLVERARDRRHQDAGTE